MDGLPIRGVTWIVVLIIVNALVEAMVTAFENASEAGMEKRAEDGDERAKQVLYLMEHHRRYITVTDLVRILAIAGIAVAYVTCIWKELLSWICLAFMAGEITDCMYRPSKAMLVYLLAGIITAVVVMFVELLAIKLPKKFAFKHADGYARSMAGMLRFLLMIFAPFAWIIEKVTAGILKLFHIKATEEDVVTEEELIFTVTEAQESGVLEAEEAEMIHNIFEFDAKEVNDIMTHRKNMVALDADMPLVEAMKFMLNAAYSRFPVYEDAVENIIGILHMKDVMRLYLSGNPERMKNRKVKSIAKKPYFVPDTQSLDVLFHAMQKKKIHMAIAIDEYGQTAGLVTMEDILEEIVGDIQDEYDAEEEDIILEESGSYLVKGMTNLEDLAETLEMEIEEEDFDTLNGLMISKLDHIPEENERATLYSHGLQMDILEVKNKMITLARVTKLPDEEEEETEEE